MGSVPGNVYDITARLVKTGTPVGSTKSSTGNSDDPGAPAVAHNLGGAADLWGTTWTVTEINEQLGVDVAFDLGTGVNESGFQYDAVGVTVHYTLPTGAAGRATTIAIGISPFLRGG